MMKTVFAPGSAAVVQNTLLNRLEAVLEGLTRAGAVAGNDSSDNTAAVTPLMGVITLLLRTLRKNQEALKEDVAQRLGASLCGVLSAHSQLRWPALEGTLRALSEMATLIDSPIGHARQVIGPYLEAKVLQPLAAILAKASAEGGPSSQERWLEEFQEQWTAHQSGAQELPDSALLERELLDRCSLGAGAEQPGSNMPEGRARCLRVLLSARRLNLSLNAGEHSQKLDEMPGLDEAEEKERERFQPGVPVHLGRVNRVKCVRVRAGKDGVQEVLYLISSQSLLILVRPDEQKPFWAVPVIVEALRSVRFRLDPAHLQEGGASATARGLLKVGGPLEQIPIPGLNGEESARALRLEVISPSSPELQKQLQPVLGSKMPTFNPPTRAGMPQAQGIQDGMAQTMPMAPLMPGAGMDDKIAHSLPNAMNADVNAGSSASRSTPLVLLFADDRRKRVACKIFVQARHSVCQRMATGLETFLEEARHAR
jgi:hypothetical protein